jgi:hypothetical protein
MGYSLHAEGNQWYGRTVKIEDGEDTELSDITSSRRTSTYAEAKH